MITDLPKYNHSSNYFSEFYINDGGENQLA